MKQGDIDNWFKYHSPTLKQLSKYNELRNSAKAFAELFDKCVPDCADKTAAMRSLREVLMKMNLAIACYPEAENRDHEALGTVKDAYGAKEKVLASHPHAHVTASPKFPGIVTLFTKEGHSLNALDEETAWQAMADAIEREKNL